MSSMTGYFFAGSNSRGRQMIPQMSVFPSRPFATKTSGASHPPDFNTEMSADSSPQTKLAV